MISSFCNADKPQCIDVDSTEMGVTLRNTDKPSFYVFATHEEWNAFVEGVKAGEFEYPNLVPAV